MDEAGLYDDKGSRMARPSDAEVARYSNNAYNQADGPSRREFLRYVGAVAAGAAFGLPLVNCGSPTEPSKIYTIQGNVIGTFGRQPMNIGQASAGAIAGTINGSSFEIKDVPPGYYNISVDGGGVQTRRVLSNVNVDRNMVVPIDAVEKPFNWQHYRNVSPGFSRRFAGRNFVIKTLRTDRNGDAPRLVELYPNISRGLLNASYGGIVQDTSSATVGDIFIHWDDPIPGGVGSTVVPRLNNANQYIVDWAEIYVSLGGSVKQLFHEGAGCLYFTGDGGPGSILKSSPPLPENPSEDDRDAVWLKYMREPRYEPQDGVDASLFNLV
ncbi:MAG TPA: twin-arginine translocation signal domain-containing protein [archaeon]|nr:twin-arginine translocation signal domain-containing protein [archaeon]